MYIRYGNTPLTRLAAVELHPRVVHGVVPDSEGVDSRPEAPSGPLADTWMRLAGGDESDEIADVGGHDCAAPAVGAVAEVAEKEDDGEGEGGADRSEGVGGDAVEAKGPGIY